MHGYVGFRELDRQECLRLLPLVPIGRVVYTERALPAVLPVSFCLDNDFAVLVRTSAAARLQHSVDGNVVAFEVDHFDEATRTGWSVIVTGHAKVVTDPREHAHLRRHGRSGVQPAEEVFVRIDPELVTGRSLSG